jgi:hypothetical protein
MTHCNFIATSKFTLTVVINIRCEVNLMLIKCALQLCDIKSNEGVPKNEGKDQL